MNVILLFGGQSPEHEISLLSARNIKSALLTAGHTIIYIGITKESGQWHLFRDIPHVERIAEDQTAPIVYLQKKNGSPCVVFQDCSEKAVAFDCVFPITHGQCGEDGTLQGKLQMLGIPFVGPSCASSSVCMDKDYSKKILEAHNLPVVPYITVYENTSLSYAEATKILGSTLFIKPANAGSSIGVSKAKTEDEFYTALQKAFSYDSKVLIETAIVGKEVECAVLGNSDTIVSDIAEIIPSHDFYSYEAKYLDPSGAHFIIPAAIPDAVTEEMKSIAQKAFKALGCQGLARVDCFITENNTLYINELNTLPGFTHISMYPTLMEKAGIATHELVDRLLFLAIEAHKKRSSFDLRR